MTTTQSEHATAAILRSIIHSLARHKATKRGHGVPLWSVVADLVCIGSTSAALLCEQHGADPHAYVLDPQWVDTSHQAVVEMCPACWGVVDYGTVCPCGHKQEEE